MSGVTGTWTEIKAPEGYYELLPLPGDDEELVPNDQVWITYSLFQLGDWIIAYQVGEIEKKIEADGRFQLLSYIYDEDGKELTLKCRVRAPDEVGPGVQLAGGWAIAGVLALMVAVAYIAYDAGAKKHVFRITTQEAIKQINQIKADPNLSEAEKVHLIGNVLQSGQVPSASAGWTDWAMIVGLALLSLLAVAWFRGHR